MPTRIFREFVSFIAAVALCMMTFGEAVGQTAKTKSAIQTEITTQFPDNTSGAITPQNLRNVTTDTLYSYVDWLTCTASGGIIYYNYLSTPTCLPAGPTGYYLQLNSATPQWASVLQSITAGTGIVISGQPTATIAMTIPPIGLNIASRFGSMDVFQRGAGSSAAIAVTASASPYTADGCYLRTFANQASTVSATTGIANLSNLAAYVQRNSAETGVVQMQYGCPMDTDEIKSFAGTFVTLSGTIKSAVNFSPTSQALTVALTCGTGSPKKQASGFTSQTTPITTTLTLTSTATRFQATSAAIVPTTCTQAEIQFIWTPTGTAAGSDGFVVDDVQLEAVNSSTATAGQYQVLNFTQQLLQAQRYFAKTFPYGVAPAQAGGLPGSMCMMSQVSNTNQGMNWQFPTNLRAAPNPGLVVTFNPVSSAATWRDVSNGNDKAVTVDPAGTLSATSVWLIASGSNTAIAANNCIQLTVDASLN